MDLEIAFDCGHRAASGAARGQGTAGTGDEGWRGGEAADLVI